MKQAPKEVAAFVFLSADQAQKALDLISHHHMGVGKLGDNFELLIITSDAVVRDVAAQIARNMGGNSVSKFDRA